MTACGIIFDLDGTLLDTLDDIAFSMNAALERFGAPSLAADDYRRHVGQGLDELARRVLPEGVRDEATVRQCVTAMREVYATRWAHATRPYAGIVAMLETLSARNVPLAVHSNKAHDFTVQTVTHFFGAGTFRAVLGGGKLPLKPDPAGALYLADALCLQPADLLFVGDSNVDMQTAVNAGMHPVGVTWGFRSRQELLDAGARELADKPADLIGILDRSTNASS